MNTQIKILMGLLAIAVVGLAIALFQGGDDPLLTETPGGDPAVRDVDKAPEQRKGSSADKKRRGDVTADPVRVEADITTSGADHLQGIQGIVVDEYDAPVEGARVYLMPGLGVDSLRMFKQHQQGVRFPAIAQAETGTDGVFKLGIEKWTEGRQYEVRITHDDYCDAKLPNVIVQPQDWYDAGNCKIKEGVTVFGRVTTDTGLPIPNASVSVRDGSGALNITPTPGREDGKTAETNASGDYEIRNLDPVAMFAMNAIAPNFAKEERPELQLDVGKRHQVDFQLAPGLDIAGTVVDPSGIAIRGAKVTVAALSQKSRQTEITSTGTDGYFITPGLKTGVYTVLVEADGFLTADEKPIPAGRKDLTITLERQGTVIVTVLGKTGQPLSAFHCNLKAAFDGQDTFGNPIVSKPVKGAANGTVTITGVNPLTYVAEIFADGHAKNFSERFTITEGQQEPPRVTVQLDEGGVIHGFAKDNRGQPIKGVKISTMPNGMVENPFTKMFQVPYTITNSSRVTTQTGEFRFNMLISGKYQLKLEHTEFCTMFVKDIEVQNGKATTLGDVMMARGCLITGIARVSGKVAGQVRVNVSAVQDGTKASIPFSCEAVTDNEGRFLLNKRLKPGKYQVMAAQNVQANPLLMMVQFNKSKQFFSISDNQENYVLNVTLEAFK